MEETGFYSRAKPTDGVIESRSLRGRARTPDQIDKSIKYSSVIDELKATAIFELSGAPCIYFTELAQPDPDPATLARLHNIAWNHGLAPILWIVTPTEVRLYNCYSKPQYEDNINPKQHLLALFQQTEQGLRELSEFAGRLQMETGAFWQDERTQGIDRRQRVDASLLKDLEDAEKKLVRAGLDPATAHALLARSIFVAYLQARNIVSASFLAQRFGAERFADILHSKAATYQLFEWVQSTFNGNLFPLVRNGTHEQDLVDEKRHLSVVQWLFAGTQIATGQGRLWPYNFKVISIELISSIYEKFAHAGDPKQAKARSTHYTPINLVDLTLSEVFRSLSAEAKILDLSCGSGVFLVESLRRLVARQIASGKSHTRKLVRDVLYQQLYGIDISDEAVQIAAFSLYLTALELDPKPEPPEALKFEPLIGRNLFIADAFDEDHKFNRLNPFTHRGFHAIVGNPPWSRSEFTASATTYCERHNRPLSRNNPDQAFLWRAGDFANRTTTLGLILHGRPFFSHTGEAAKTRSALLATYTPIVLVNLANLRNSGLFPNAKAPAMILIAQARAPEPGEHFYLVCPETTDMFGKHGIIEIGQENIKRLPIIRAAGNQDVLKIASWGSPRDDALIQRLSGTFPMFGDLLKSKEKVWFPGQGYQEVAGGMDADVLYLKPWLQSGVMPRYQVDPDRLPAFTKRKLHRTRDPRIYRGPLILTTRGITDAGFYAAVSPRDVVYTEEYYGIAVPQADSRYLSFLNGIFNSNLASYYFFLTASVWGVERDKVEPNDLMRFPTPQLSEGSQTLVDRIVAIEAELRKLADSHISEQGASLRNQLNDAVYDLYGLSEEERACVNDTVSYSIDLFAKGQESVAFRSPTRHDLEVYAEQCCHVLQPFLDTLGERRIITDIFIAARSALQVVKFSLVTPLSHRAQITVHDDLPTLGDLLNRVASQLPHRVAPTLTMRRMLRIYTNNAFYLVKLSQVRYWTRSAAMDDADRIIADHLRTSHDTLQ